TRDLARRSTPCSRRLGRPARGSPAKAARPSGAATRASSSIRTATPGRSPTTRTGPSAPTARSSYRRAKAEAPKCRHLRRSPPGTDGNHSAAGFRTAPSGAVSHSGHTIARMPTPTEHLRVRARRIVEEARRLVPLRAALLAGSAGRGDADFYSDIDLLLYVDELPTDETVAAVRDVVGGTDPSGKERTEQACGEEFDLDGVHAEMVFFKVREFEARLDDLLDRLVDFDAPTQKILMGLAEGLALEGADLIERWRARVSDFPEPLRRAMIERYWTFFPLWYYTDVLAEHDAELWRLDVLVEAAFNLLG